MNDRSKANIRSTFLAVVLCMVWSGSQVGVATEPNATRVGTLRLSDGDVFKGEFSSSGEPDQTDKSKNELENPSPFFHWSCPTFREPL